MDPKTGLALTTLFTGAMFLPYVLARIGVVGVWGALENPTPTTDDRLPAWAKRAKQAHANAVENLVVFVGVTAAALWSNPVPSSGLGLAVAVYLAARVVHYASYTLGIPVVRTLSFLTGVGAQFAIGFAALGLW